MYRIILLLTILAAVYWPSLQWMADKYTAADSAYSHGFLVPFVSAFLIWRKRKQLADLDKVSSKFGLILIIGGLLAYFLSSLVTINFIAAFSLLPVIFGITLYLWGGKVTKKILFPILFLGFMFPMPSVLTIYLTFKLKLFASACAVWLAQCINVPAIQRGAIVYLPNSVLEVGNPCSGLRSLISLLAIGALFAYISPLSLFKRRILFMAAFPIAIFSNILRILSLILVSFVYGKEAASGLFHDISGMGVFIMAVAGMAAIEKLLKGAGQDE